MAPDSRVCVRLDRRDSDPRSAVLTASLSSALFCERDHGGIYFAGLNELTAQNEQATPLMRGSEDNSGGWRIRDQRGLFLPPLPVVGLID
jgi:hypothetical protein